MLGKIDLPPAFGPAQLSDALARRCTDVLCHASMFGLVYALYVAHTLFGVSCWAMVNSGLGGACGSAVSE
jgi:hypothetical protein